jgi:hypothetical protein
MGGSVSPTLITPPIGHCVAWESAEPTRRSRFGRAEPRRRLFIPSSRPAYSRTSIHRLGSSTSQPSHHGHPVKRIDELLLMELEGEPDVSIPVSPGRADGRVVRRLSGRDDRRANHSTNELRLCGLPRWLTCYSALGVASGSTTPSSRGRPATRFVSSFRRSAPWSA